MITFGLGAALLEIRQMALDALNEAGEQELAELVSHVHSGSADAASSLATLGSAGVEILASGLCCLDGTVAQSCADALGTIGETVVPFLVETARNSQRLVFRMVERLWAVRALGRTKSNAAVEVLKWIVAESEQAERRDYEAELTPRDPWLAEAKARLMTLWHNDYTRIRIYASEALGNIGSKPAIDALARLAKWYNWAESSEVKRAARKALQTIQT